MRIDGKGALVTGGASGLGRATAEALHAAGAQVLLVDLPTSQGESVAKEIGEGTAFAPADVTSESDVTAAVDRAVELWGGLHVAVNCAGIGWAQRTVSRNGPHDLAIFAKVIEVNAIGTFNVTRLAAVRIAEQEPEGEERGVIVNTSSIAAYDGQTGQAAYAASKGAVVSMTLPIARDLARSRIRCVTIAPGTFETPLMMQLPEPARKELEAETPHPARLGRAEEYAALVIHIVENPMLNGEVIRLDGALRMPFTR
ncbi:MAG TPA: 3-hydroxyacyl-CoA dehydrogenase [Actinomycetota bacterium]|nr:3-hydroxyacyl-CoA dehydrogenase [Actinomycetota bacterium]